MVAICGEPARRHPCPSAAPPVTVPDGRPHTPAFPVTINRGPATSLGGTRFGQSGSIQNVHRRHGLDAAAIVRADLDLADG